MSKITTEKINLLARAAVAAKKNSYSPYSRFKVGAAVLAEDGTVYTGTNVENASFGLTVCAERNAIFAAVCNGQRKLRALALCTDPVPGQKFGSPCGACRQVMIQYQTKSGKPMSVILVGADHIKKFARVNDILPLIFDNI